MEALTLSFYEINKEPIFFFRLIRNIFNINFKLERCTIFVFFKNLSERERKKIWKSLLYSKH